jgi:hypothetical protein
MQLKLFNPNPRQTKPKLETNFDPNHHSQPNSQDRNLDQNQTKNKTKTKTELHLSPSQERWLVVLVRHFVDLENISTKLIERPLIQVMLEDVRVNFN